MERTYFQVKVLRERLDADRSKYYGIIYMAAFSLIQKGHSGQITRNARSRSEVFYEKGVLRNFAKACNFIKIETLAQVLSCKCCEISKKTFSNRIAPVAAFVLRAEQLI